MTSIRETRTTSASLPHIAQTLPSSGEQIVQNPHREFDSISSSQGISHESNSNCITKAFRAIKRAVFNFFQFLLNCCSRRAIVTPDTPGTRVGDNSASGSSARTHEEREASSSRESSSIVEERQAHEREEQTASEGAIRRQRLVERMDNLTIRVVQDEINRIQQNTEGSPEFLLWSLDRSLERLDSRENAAYRPLIEQANRLEQQYVRRRLEEFRREVDDLNRRYCPDGVDNSTSLGSPVQSLDQEPINSRLATLASLRRRLGPASDPALVRLADQIQASMQHFVRATTNRQYPASPIPHRCQIRPAAHQVEALQDLRQLNDIPEARPYAYRIGNTQIKILSGFLMNQMVNSLVSSTAEGELMTDDSILTRGLRNNNPQIVEELTSFQEVRPGVRIPAGQAIFTRGYALSRGEFHSSVIHTAGPSLEIQEQFENLMYRRRDLARNTNQITTHMPILIELTRIQIDTLTNVAESLVSPQVLHDSIYNSLVEAHEHGETSIAMRPFYDVRPVPELNNPDRSECTSSYDFKHCIRADKGAQVISQALRHFNQDFPNSPLRDIRFICEGEGEFKVLYNVFRSLLGSTVLS